MKYIRITNKEYGNSFMTVADDTKLQDGWAEVSEAEYSNGVEELKKSAEARLDSIKESAKKTAELQDKAVLVGLSDEEKKEYAKLKGIKI